MSLEIFKLFVKYHIKDIVMSSAKGIQSLVFKKLPFFQTSSHFSDGIGQQSQTHSMIFLGVFCSEARLNDPSECLLTQDSETFLVPLNTYSALYCLKSSVSQISFRVL